MSGLALLAIPETASRLRVTANTVYGLIVSGDLAATDIGGAGESRRARTRIRVDVVDAFIASRTRDASRGLVTKGQPA